MFASSRRVTYQIVLRRREVDAKLISRKKCEHSGMKKEGAHHACAQSEFTKQGIGGRDLRSILGFPYKTSSIFGFVDPLPASPLYPQDLFSVCPQIHGIFYPLPPSVQASYMEDPL